MRFVILSVWPVGLSWGQDRRRNMGDDMGPLVIRCEGRTWQDDFGALAPRLYAAYRRWFRGRSDSEESVQEAVCWSMEAYSRVWEPGSVVVLWPRQAILRVRAGRRWVRRRSPAQYGQVRGRSRSERLTAADLLAPARPGDYCDRDMILDAYGVGPQHGRAVLYLALGVAREDAARRMRINLRRYIRLIEEVLCLTHEGSAASR